MFKMDDTVRIRKTGVVGSITDISCAGGSTVYVIDTDTGDCLLYTSPSPRD